MAKYKVTTEDGVYEVTTEDGPKAAPVKPSPTTAPVPGRDRDPQTGLELPGMPGVPGAPTTATTLPYSKNLVSARQRRQTRKETGFPEIAHGDQNPIVNAIMAPIASGSVQAGQGLTDIAHAQSFDEVAGGASTMIRGLGTASLPFTGPLALQAAVAAPVATLGGLAAGFGTQAAVENVAPMLGAGPGTSALLGDIAGFKAGSWASKKLPAKWGPTTKFQPAPPEEPLAQAYRFKSQQIPKVGETINRGGAELLQDSPDLGNGKFPITRPGTTTVEILNRHTDVTLPRIWKEADQAMQPLYAQGVSTQVPQVQANVDAVLNHDPVTMQKSWDNVSNDIRASIEGMKGNDYSLENLLTLIKEDNNLLAKYHRMGEAGQREAGLKGGDVAVIQARVNGYRDALYSRVKQVSAPLAEFVKDRMASYGSVAQMRNALETQLGEAYAEVPKSGISRLIQGGIALAKGTSALGSGGTVGWALPHAQHAVSPDKTIATSLLNGFAELAKGGKLPTPAQAPLMLQYTQNQIPMALPPSRQIAAPTGPVGVSGVTVPDVTGQLQTQMRQQAAGPRRLAAPSGPVGVSGTTMPDAGGQIRGLVNRESAGPLLLPAPTPGVPPQGFTQGPGNLGFGSQHSVVQPGQFNLPNQMPLPAHALPPPTPSGPIDPSTVASFAQRNGLTYVQALQRLQLGGR